MTEENKLLIKQEKAITEETTAVFLPIADNGGDFDAFSVKQEAANQDSHINAPAITKDSR
jgi:hypothetical protein